MLKLLVKDCNIVRTIKLLAQNNMTAKVDIVNSTITIEGELTESLAKDLYESVDAFNIVNFDLPFFNHSSTTSTDPVLDSDIQDDIDVYEGEELNEDSNAESTSYKPNNSVDAQYQTKHVSHPHKNGRFRRGEIYMCDFGRVIGSEQGSVRPALIIQNDRGNYFSPTTIVIPITSAHKNKKMPTHLLFNWEKEIMYEISTNPSMQKPSTLLAEQIRTVSKQRLTKYLGTFTSEFMDTQVQPLIEASLSVSPKVETITEIKTVVKEVPSTIVKEVPTIKTEVSDLKDIQVALLASVDVSQLLSISKTDSLDSVEKAKKMLELFGFDLEGRGVTYILDAITVKQKDYNVTLKALSAGVAKLHGSTITADEIERLIVARIKENFNMKKSPAIHFIRLIRSLVCKNN